MDFCSKVGVKLLLTGLEKDDTKNMLTSPLSYNAIINMLAAGSSGDTLDQILRVLQHKNIEDVNSESSKFAEVTSETPTKTKKRKIGYLGQEDDGEEPIISFLNGVWVNQDYCLKESFKDLLLNLYKAKVDSINVQKAELVIQEINEWVSASTKGLIKKVFKKEHITTTTTLIIGNALYFKGSWEKPFEKTLTRKESFYLLNGEDIEVPFMRGCKRYSSQSYQGFQVARIPYSAGGDVNRKFAMYIFLPDEKDGLKSLLKDVNSNLEFFEQYCAPRAVCGKADIFWIPKFKFSYLTEECPKIMEDMGLTLPFDMKRSELGEMIKEEDLYENLYVTKIIQNAFIEVNEEGTEAAAGTYEPTSPGYSPNPPPPTKFVADHPFMLAIREETSGILFFVGAILNPLEDCASS